MKTRLILSGAAAMLCAGALSSAQIAPQGGFSSGLHSRNAAASSQHRTAGPVTTLAGCLYREESIPGRSPNVAEKAGAGEDFILADATLASRTVRRIDLSRMPDSRDAGPVAQASPLVACTR